MLVCIYDIMFNFRKFSPRSLNVCLKVFIVFVLGLFFRFVLDILGFYINELSELIWLLLFFFFANFELPSAQVVEYFSFRELDNLSLVKKSYNCFSSNNDNNSVSSFNDFLRRNNQNNEFNFIQRCRCKIYWNLVEKNKVNHLSYDEFKTMWDSNNIILRDFKDRLKSDYQEEMHKWSVRKMTFKWFLNRR